MNQQGRFQAPELTGPGPLRPAPLPGDTFTGAPRPVIDNSSANLADALGSFNSNLLAFGSAAARTNKQNEKILGEQMANMQIGAHSNKDYIEGVESGAIGADKNPYYRAVVQNHYGQTKGYAVVGAMQEQFKSGGFRMTGDTPMDNAPDVNDWITQQAMPTLQSLANNPMALKSFTRKVDAFREDATKQQATAKVAQMNTWREGIATDNFNKLFDMGANPEITHNLSRSVYAELGPGTWANLSRQQLDKSLVQVLGDRAAKPETAEAALKVLMFPRKDALTGEEVPPLATNPAYAEKVASIKAAATSTLATKYVKDTTHLAAVNAGEALERKDGSFGTLLDTPVPNPIKPADAPFIVKADAARKEAVTNFLAKSAQDGKSPEARFENEADVLMSNNIAHPAWKATLEDGAKALTSPAALTDPAQRQRAIAAGELGNTLAERNYPYLKNTIGLDKGAEDFHTVYRTVRNTMGLNQDQALDYAAQATRTPENDNDMAVRTQRAKTVAEKVAATNWSGAFLNFFPGVSETTKNVSDVQRRVMDVASVLTRVPGVSLDDSVKYAMKTVSERSMVINGHVIPDVGVMSKQQKPYIEQLLGIFHTQHGKEVGLEGTSDLSVVPAGGGAFSIWSYAHGDGGGHPVYVTDAKGNTVPATITPAQIQQLSKDEAGVRAWQTEQASKKSRDDAIKFTNTPATPETAARRAELRTEARKAQSEFNERRLSEMGASSFDTPAPSLEHLYEMGRSLKQGAQSSFYLLSRLNILPQRGLASAPRVPNGQTPNARYPR